MRACLALMLVVVAGCPSGDDDAEPDAGAIRLECSPPVDSEGSPGGFTALPLGEFPVTVACLAGCDSPLPPVVLHADRFVITKNGAGADIDFMAGDQTIGGTWARAEGLCWRTTGNTCSSQISLCATPAGRLTSAPVTHRTPAEVMPGVPDVVWQVQ